MSDAKVEECNIVSNDVMNSHVGRTISSETICEEEMHAKTKKLFIEREEGELSESDEDAEIDEPLQNSRQELSGGKGQLTSPRTDNETNLAVTEQDLVIIVHSDKVLLVEEGSYPSIVVAAGVEADTEKELLGNSNHTIADLKSSDLVEKTDRPEELSASSIVSSVNVEQTGIEEIVSGCSDVGAIGEKFEKEKEFESISSFTPIVGSSNNRIPEHDELEEGEIKSPDPNRVVGICISTPNNDSHILNIPENITAVENTLLDGDGDCAKAFIECNSLNIIGLGSPLENARVELNSENGNKKIKNQKESVSSKKDKNDVKVCTKSESFRILNTDEKGKNIKVGKKGEKERFKSQKTTNFDEKKTLRKSIADIRPQPKPQERVEILKVDDITDYTERSENLFFLLEAIWSKSDVKIVTVQVPVSKKEDLKHQNGFSHKQRNERKLLWSQCKFENPKQIQEKKNSTNKIVEDSLPVFGPDYLFQSPKRSLNSGSERWDQSPSPRLYRKERKFKMFIPKTTTSTQRPKPYDRPQPSDPSQTVGAYFYKCVPPLPHCPYTTRARIPLNFVTPYDSRGRLRRNGADICDCGYEACSGCWYACYRCGSTKCGMSCRIHRMICPDTWMPQRN